MISRPILLFFLFLVIGTGKLSGQCYGTLVWQDEFNGSSLDLTKWNYETGNGCPSLCGWGNNEMEYYTTSANNIRVTGGNLVLEARAEAMGGSSFSSAKILSRNIAYWTYGRFEARMRMPEGRGLWPAFWMLPQVNNWPTTGEIDIMEYRGDLPTRTSGTLHYGNPWPQNLYDGVDHFHTSNLASAFNIYAAEWDANEIRWYLNDRVIKIETRTPNSLNPPSNNANVWPWTNDFFIILNLAVGGWFPATTNPGDVVLTKPTFEVDYVRVYNMATAVGSQFPYWGTPSPIPGKIEAEEFDHGCDQAAYYDTDLPNNGNAFRGERVDIEACTDVGGGFNVGWTANGEWMEYTVNVASTGTYDLAFRVASATGGGRLHVEMDGADITGQVNLPNTGAWTNWQTVTVTNRSMTAGNHIMRIYVENTGFNLNYVNISANTILPVSLLQFSGTSNEDHNLLEWTTTEEKDNDHFSVERSVNGSDWQEAVRIKAGNNPKQIQEYSWKDFLPENAKIYYRLKQTDLDGTSNYSEMISVERNEVSIQLIPNPFTDQTSIRVPENIKELVITDITGNEILKVDTKETKLVTLGENLAKGIYFVKLANGRTEKLIKQ